MVFFVAISLMLLALACLARGIGLHFPAMGRALVVTGSLIGIAVLAIPLGFLPGSAISWQDPLPSAVAIVGLLSCLLVALLDASAVRQSATCWSAGLLVAASVSSQPILIWSALQFSVFALMFYGREGATGKVPFWGRHPSLLLGSLFFTLGFFLHLRSDSETILRTISMALLLCGIGGMLGWFPFPRVANVQLTDAPILAMVGQRFLPALTAAIVLWKLGELSHYSRSESFLLAIASLFSLVICSMRLWKEELFSRRLMLISLSMLSFLMVALFVQNWEWTHPDRDWIESSNLPTGRSVFVSILLCESIGLLLLICGHQLLQSAPNGQDVTATLSGAANQRSAASLPLVLGLLNACGVPPFPSFWWRLGLIVICLLPHRQSNMTRVVEGDNAYSFVAILLLVAMMIYSLGNLRLLQRVLFEQGFRIRERSRSGSVSLAVMIALISFLAITCVPLSLERHLVRVPVPLTELSLTPIEE